MMREKNLAKILNKLATAAPQPYQIAPNYPTERILPNDPCKKLMNSGIMAEVEALCNDTPRPMSNIPKINTEVYTEFFQGLMEILERFLELYCKCRKKQQDDGVPLASQHGIEEALRNTMNNPDLYHGPNWMREALGLQAFVLLWVVKFDLEGDRIDQFCSIMEYSAPLSDSEQIKEFIKELVRDLHNYFPPVLIDMIPRDSVFNATPITPCAEPKVAIIEDYLVEQGLAIGVAGILGATALGLYLRGNRAAAVALIATATAAVGGTATGAESVMNDVETDYNRSVRFGGQQDCRDSNQTGTAEHGD